MDQNSERFIEWFYSLGWVPHEAAIKTLVRASAIFRSNRAGESTPKVAVGRRLQLLATCVSPQGCLSVLMTWQLASPKTCDLGERKTKEESTVPFMTSSQKSHTIASVKFYSSETG